jgi:glucose-fructose oxidoreductase
MSPSQKRAKADRPKVRYAVVGLGHIAQSAVLPAFAHAAENSQLTALVSGDPTKLERLGRKYRVKARYTYDQFDQMLEARVADAVYIALPNDLHCEYTVRSASGGLHVICEKPMAPTEEDCRAMIEACEHHRVALMVAYRLHFDEANLKAVDVVQAGKLGEPRLFHSVFTQQVRSGDIRLRPPARGGGPLYDIGVYCINAARMVFADEPVEVFATTASASDPRFAEAPEMASAVLRFPRERLASFVCSFGAARVDSYQVVGTAGDLVVDPAYDYDRPLVHYLTVNGRTRERTFARHDQFAPELVAFSECVFAGAEPEPSGREGLADIRVIRALHHSADTGRPVLLGAFVRERRPTLDQVIRKPPLRAPGLVHAEAPTMG